MKARRSRQVDCPRASTPTPIRSAPPTRPAMERLRSASAASSATNPAKPPCGRRSCIAWERHPDGLIQGIMPGGPPAPRGADRRDARERRDAPASDDRHRRPGARVRAAPRAGRRPGRGRVVPVGSDPDIRIPRRRDLLLWIQPRNPTRADAATLERFLASGRSVILAGSSCLLEPVPEADGAPLACRRRASHELARPAAHASASSRTRCSSSTSTMRQITWHVGRRPVKADAPFQLRILPSCLDTQDPARPELRRAARQRGRRAALGSGRARRGGAGAPSCSRRRSESSSATEVPEDGLRRIAPRRRDRPVPKQPWLVRLAAKDAGRAI